MKLAPGDRDSKAHIVVDDQALVNGTDRERTPVRDLALWIQAPLGAKDPFVGQLRQVTGIVIAHTGNHEPQAIGLRRHPSKPCGKVRGDPATDAIKARIVPLQLEVVRLEVARATRKDLVGAQRQMSKLGTQRPGTRRHTLLRCVLRPPV